MGNYLNPDNSKFGEAVNSAVYIDKTGLIEYTNSVLHTMQDNVCVSRPQGRAGQVAEGMKQAHFETSHIQYHDENALSYTISLALYAARNFYTVHRELAGGKGFADLVFIPRRQFPDKPALLVELKWDKSARGAIQQIREKEYFQSLKEYYGNLLLVGVNYDRKTREHTCVIEKFCPAD